MIDPKELARIKAAARKAGDGALRGVLGDAEADKRRDADLLKDVFNAALGDSARPVDFAPIVEEYGLTEAEATAARDRLIAAGKLALDTDGRVRITSEGIAHAKFKPLK